MTRKIAGCDLGKATACFVVGHLDDDGAFVLDDHRVEFHEGGPMARFSRWYGEAGVAGCAALGATGVYASQLVHPVLQLPEDACQEAAIGREFPDGPVNLVSVGARGYSVLARTADGRFEYLENDKCSSGAGENVVKIAGRFGLTLAQADELALTAEKGVPITARCSVFTKSEMTHHANQGKPTAALLRGYFDSMVHNTVALLARNQAEGPVYLVGGCADIESFQRSFGERVEREVRRPAHASVFEALGAALLAAREVTGGDAVPLPSEPDGLIEVEAEQFRVLQPAREWADQVRILPATEPPGDWTEHPVILGLDLGSTGAKAVLVSVATGEPVLDVYDRTRGNPVDATRRLVSAILDRCDPDVRAMGVTGSGRVAAAALLEAVFGGDGAVVVANEIAAHATAAMRVDEDGGDDLSVIEIGGQDAKYIRIRGGRIVDSDLNQACSAGTGSFLEEQARIYDVTDIEQVVGMAREAIRPPDLGQMCTVYMADAAAAALGDDFDLGDVFAGFQYSIVHNYLNRVMGQRKLAKRVFFQGKPASSDSLAWTLAAVTGTKIIVPPNPGAMGAWGIAIQAQERLGGDALAVAARLELASVLGAEIVSRSEFQCRDKECATLCPIDRTVIDVDGEEHIALSGGACPKYEVAGRSAQRLPKGAPDPFAERARLLAALEHEQPDGVTVSIPLTGAVGSHLPWLATFAREVGFGVRILASDAGTLARGEQLCNSFDSCGPTKIAHALCEGSGPVLLFPMIPDVGDRCGFSGQTCVTQQAMPQLVEQAMAARGVDVEVVRPVLSFDRDTETGDFRRGERLAAALAAATGVEAYPDQVRDAIERAGAAQQAFDDVLLAAGEGAAGFARERGLPLVVVCGHRHVIHDRAIHANIPHLIRQNGAMAIPMDAFPLDPAAPDMARVYWGDANRSMRAAWTAHEAGDAYPLMLSSFGCGPASFTEPVFSSLLEGYPHTILESDGHGGAAGYVTRIQAFLHSVQQHRGEPDTEASERSRQALSYIGPSQRKGAYLDRDARYVFLSGPDYLGDMFAAIYRAYGYDAHVAPPMSHDNLDRGRRNCTGKECISYQLLWGCFREYLENNPTDKEVRLMQIAGQMCRGGMFATKDRLAVSEMGLADRVSVQPIRIAGGVGMSTRVWVGMTALDILRQFYLYFLAAEDRPGHAEELYRGFGERMIQLYERPARTGALAGLQLARQWSDTRRLLSEASAAFAAFGEGSDDALRTVFVSGDALTKGNDFANAGLFQYLASKGVRAIPEPLNDFLEFLAIDHPHLLFGRNAGRMVPLTFRPSMAVIRRQLYSLVRRQHPWLPQPDTRAALRRADPILTRATNGGSVLAVGNVLHHLDHHPFDGVVMTSCWGCDNGLIEESLLRHHSKVPSLFFYDDAMPLDTRRVDSYAFRLGRGARPSSSP